MWDCWLTGQMCIYIKCTGHIFFFKNETVFHYPAQDGVEQLFTCIIITNWAQAILTPHQPCCSLKDRYNHNWL